MPRSSLLPALSLLALIGLAASTTAAPLIPDVLHGAGVATTFYVEGRGKAIEGGLHDWTDLCTDCLLRINVAAGAFTVVDGTGARTLEPGLYEIREFTGLFQHTEQARFQHTVEIHGLGKLVEP